MIMSHVPNSECKLSEMISLQNGGVTWYEQRSFNLTTLLSLPTGMKLTFRYRYHNRARFSFTECFSILDLVIDRGQERCKVELFGYDDSVTNEVFTRRVNGDVLGALAILLFPDVAVSKLKMAELVTLLAGVDVWGKDRWMIKLAYKKFGDLLPHEDFVDPDALVGWDYVEEEEDHRSLLQMPGGFGGGGLGGPFRGLGDLGLF